MGKISFDPLQSIIVEEFKKNTPLSKHFYFTGETALSVYYFQHRLSEDLDFFSETKFSEELVRRFITDCAKKHKFKVTVRKPQRFDILIYQLDFGSKGTLKVDFNYYPYKRIEKSKQIDGIMVDSLRDIGANKLTTIIQRTQVRDFVDLYFLLKKFTFWDLWYGLEAKFHIKYELFMFADDFLKAEEFTELPTMLVPLTLKELHSFFREKALEIGRRITK